MPRAPNQINTVRSGDTGHFNDLINDSMLYKNRSINPCMVDFIVLFNKTQALEYKSQLTFMFLAAVNHLSKPLRKQDSTSDEFKSSWLIKFQSLCVIEKSSNGKLYFHFASHQEV